MPNRPAFAQSGFRTGLPIWPAEKSSEKGGVTSSAGHSLRSGSEARIAELREIPWISAARRDRLLCCSDCVAERVGFEPTIRFPVYTLSKRAPSATPPSLPSTNFARPEDLPSTGLAALRAYEATSDFNLILRSVLLNDGNLDFIVRIAGSQLGSLALAVDQSKTSKHSEQALISELLASPLPPRATFREQLQRFGFCEFRRNF